PPIRQTHRLSRPRPPRRTTHLLLANNHVRAGGDPVEHTPNAELGTPEWYDIYQRCRPAVESFFSMLTDPGKEHMDRGRIKMMGIAKTSILVAFWAAAANFRLIDAFERRLEREANPDRQYIPRKPRRRRAVPYTDRNTST